MIRTQVKSATLSGLCFEEAGTAESVSEKKLRRVASEKSTILHLPLLTSLSFFLHPSSFRIVVAFRLERLGIIFSIPRQLERVTGCLAIGPAGGDADGSILMSPRLLGRDVREQVEEDLLTHTEHIYIHTYTYTYRCTHKIGSSAYTVMHVCVGSFHTHFFPFTLEAFTRHSRPQTLTQSEAVE